MHFQEQWLLAHSSSDPEGETVREHLDKRNIIVLTFIQPMYLDRKDLVHQLISPLGVCVCTCVCVRIHAHVSVCMYVRVCVCDCNVDISVMSFVACTLAS